MTNANENTRPVRAIMPDATAEQIAIAAGALIVDTSPGNQWCSMRGKNIPTTAVANA